MGLSYRPKLLHFTRILGLVNGSEAEVKRQRAFLERWLKLNKGYHEAVILKLPGAEEELPGFWKDLEAANYDSSTCDKEWLGGNFLDALERGDSVLVPQEAYSKWVSPV
jgi:hypothetical protein